MKTDSTKTENGRSRITWADIQAARVKVEENSPRSVTYRAATELVEFALSEKVTAGPEGVKPLNVAEGLIILLKDWNAQYYRYTKKPDEQHFHDIEEILRNHDTQLREYRQQKIEELKPGIEDHVVRMFQDFESVLGPVGAAKALHVLAPGLLPLWDSDIAGHYRLKLGPARTNGERYWQFIQIAKQQCEEIRREVTPGQPATELAQAGVGLLKLIDEWNIVNITWPAKVAEGEKKTKKKEKKKKEEDSRAGREAGLKWALIQIARPERLRTLATFKEQRGDDLSAALSVMNNDGGIALGLYTIVTGTKKCRDALDSLDFWRSALGNSDPGRIQNLDFALGFIEEALEVWEALKDKLKDNATGAGEE